MVICSVVWRDKFFSPKTADLFLLQKRLDIATAVSKFEFDGIIFGVRKLDGMRLMFLRGR